jgi:hypothetical protein
MRCRLSLRAHRRLRPRLILHLRLHFPNNSYKGDSTSIRESQFHLRSRRSKFSNTTKDLLEETLEAAITTVQN